MLGATAPRIDASESSLSRPIRAVLAQLRSDHCAKVGDFQLRIGKSTDDICPECQLASDTVSHLFHCPAHATNLSIVDLWKQPREVASHLSSIPAFNQLLVVAPLPLRQRRLPAEPPPPP